MALACPHCGEENPDRARFCLACGRQLEPPPAASAEERKVVSVLFVDLVGFTAASETADPEDVRARLAPYHARVRDEVERFGGAVEKFVGDAVMAVFGAPVAHEDDAERAVRAALAVLEATGEMGLRVRAAVNTGEAVVALGARPELGEAVVAGDVVNTAARLQSAAPVDALVVGEQTYWTTRHAVEYAALDAVTVKGKAEPVALWRALRARSRLGVDLGPRRETPLVGREEELDLLRRAYARTLRESACHLVTLVGEPGIGKSRLVVELREHVDAQPEIVSWRQGRCLPYGEGIAFWALGEIVKSHAGILESDDAAVTREKLERVVEAVGASPSDAGWIGGELARLVGVGRDGGGSRDESFAAWRTFLEGVAAQRPLVLVVEDLHWADAALLAFLEYLADWATDVPLLVLCTARPELFELHPAWSGGKRNATTISLSPLTPEETARLLGNLLERAVLPADTQQQLLERAGGNPLYAEQFVAMLRERSHGGEIAVPETVQALIAARLDTLGAERKALLQDAAVMGKVFWSGAVAAIAGLDERAVREDVHELVRRELVRPARVSSVEGESEYAFWHALVRDVAYAQIPRAARVRKHETAAAWIERTAGERVPEYAELLAHHYRRAVELARAVGTPTEQLEDAARTYLALAAKRAADLDATKAASLYEAALALAPAGHPERGRLLLAAIEASDLDDRVERLLDEATAELDAHGDEVGVGKAILLRSHRHWVLGASERATALLREAVELLERQAPGPELAHAYVLSAGRDAIAGRPHESLAWTAKGIDLAQRLGLDHLVQRAVQFRGLSRCLLGDAGGVDDLEEALRVSVERGFGQEAALAFNNYGSWLWLISGADAALPVYREGIEFGERRGFAAAAMWSRGERTWALFDAGRWDEVLVTAEEIEAFAEQRGGGQPVLMALSSKARVLFYRGRVDEAAALAERVVPRAREAGDPQIVLPALSLAALVERDAAVARSLVEELLAVEAPENPLHADTARVCVAHGALDLAERMVRSDERAAPRALHVSATVRAIVAEARGEHEEAAGLYRDAVERWTAYPFALERAQCLLGLARVSADSRPAAEARELFRSLGAEPLEAQAEAILQPAA